MTARETTRDTAHFIVSLSSEVAERLHNDPNVKVMVFCAAENNSQHYAPSEIAFPHQVELKCNLDEVKANLRGLKNKPGSTRPADVTQYIRKKAGYPNALQMTYALTQKVRTPLRPSLILSPLHRMLQESIRHAYKQSQMYRNFS